MRTVMRNVLLLEGEMIIAIDIEDTLRNLGATDIFTADTCEAAMIWLRDNRPSMAIIDPRLKDGYCGPVARELGRAGIPFIVYSGDPAGAADEDNEFGKGLWVMK